MPKSILIIDDDSKNIFALYAVLNAKGFKCETASGMNEAFKILSKENNIGIILMDMMMPEMDGYEGIAKIKSDNKWKHLTVIAVTAQAMSGDKQRCLAAGADDYISKPLNIDHLQKMLNEYL